MPNAWKIGAGSGAIVLGFYLIAKFTNEIGAIIAGVILISVGIGLIASK